MDIGSCHIGTADPTVLNNVIMAGLDAHLLKSGLSVDVYSGVPYCLSAYDEANTITGGLSGMLQWDWLFINMLWVDETARGQKIGTKLLARAEADLRASGGVGMYVWAQSWNGPEFYEKCGFERFVALPDFPKGFQRIGLLKRIFGQGAEVIRP